MRTNAWTRTKARAAAKARNKAKAQANVISAEEMFQMPFAHFVAVAHKAPRKSAEVQYHWALGEALVVAGQEFDVSEVEQMVAEKTIPVMLVDQLIYVNLRHDPQGHIYYQIGLAKDRNDDRGVVALIAQLPDLKAWYPADKIKPLPPVTGGLYTHEEAVTLTYN